MSEQPPGRITGIHTIGVPVTDQDKAIGFYVGTLGFEKRMDMPLPPLGSRWIEVAPAGGAVSIALVQAHDGLPSGGECGVRFTTPDAAALHRELTAAGVDVDELLNWPGVPPMFAFRDQDGNGMEIVQDTAQQ
ncbi:VOC family protein [Pseudonocardia alaniniphila]|uniref:VOC family protein n=1 Tax=Pseudonocardia alaniniphila TaxID=75291 RepID=A0ABS9T8V2_9PSEU|nr:VOC family protein [Pseudonocardia alaniniphila]MCH6164950.1 VOC family protein [Pseudonocardia alaniniphila]